MKVTTLALKYIAFQRYAQFQVNPIPFPSCKENFTINQEYPASDDNDDDDDDGDDGSGGGGGGRDVSSFYVLDCRSIRRTSSGCVTMVTFIKYLQRFLS